MKNALLFVLLFFVLFSTSCKKDENPVNNQQPNNNGAGDIGASGGQIIHQDGTTLDIPAGALSSTQSISITSLNSTTVVNEACKIYEFKPDGLVFNDSVVAKIPYDPTELLQNSLDASTEVRIFTLENDVLKFVPSIIDTYNKIAKIKIKHFSKYIITNPGKWSTYFYQHKNDTPSKIDVPYYHQWSSKWCTYYSTAMLLKYAGYDNIPAHKLASLMGCDREHGLSGNNSEWISYDSKLNALGIQTERADPTWGSPTELMGYLISKIKAGYPVLVGSQTAHHSFVVVGFNNAGFLINDPSGYFYANATGVSLQARECSKMLLVEYDKFKSTLVNFWDYFWKYTLFGGQPEGTLVITSKNSSKSSTGPTINFIGNSSSIRLLDAGQNHILATLDLSGKYQNLGYSFIDNQMQPFTSFENSNYFWIELEVANNQNTNIPLKIHYKIDDTEIIGSPLIFNAEPLTLSYPTKVKHQLSGLNSGNHVLRIELESSNDNRICDFQEFEFTAVSSSNNPPVAPSSPSPSNGASTQPTSLTLSWSCSDPDGDNLKYDVYFGTSSNPTTTIATDQSSTSISRSGLSANTKYYWKIVARDSKDATTTGPVWNFTTAAGGTAPSAPTLSSPANNATEIGIPPTLTWNSSIGATSYTLQVSTNNSFTSYTYNQSGLTSTSQQITGLSNNILYYWRVSATNSYGTSSYSSVYKFTTIASTVTATISGKVTDNSNQSAISNAKIYTSPATTTVYSNSSGNYSITGVASGTYTVYAEKTGYNNYSSTINVVQDITQNIVMIATSATGTPCPGIPTITDSRDGRTYHTVQIGGQCWLKENLNVGTRIDGSVQAANNSTIEKYCYDNNEANCTTYGGLYQWNEAMNYSASGSNVQGICPTGWHLPTKTEFETLKAAVGNDGNALKARNQGIGSGAGTNTSGFSCLLAGHRLINNSFGSIGETTWLWGTDTSVLPLTDVYN